MAGIEVARWVRTGNDGGRGRRRALYPRQRAPLDSKMWKEGEGTELEGRPTICLIERGSGAKSGSCEGKEKHRLAQSAEHVTLDLRVLGSSPTWGVEVI